MIAPHMVLDLHTISVPEHDDGWQCSDNGFVSVICMHMLWETMDLKVLYEINNIDLMQIESIQYAQLIQNNKTRLITPYTHLERGTGDSSTSSWEQETYATFTGVQGSAYFVDKKESLLNRKFVTIGAQLLIGPLADAGRDELKRTQHLHFFRDRGIFRAKQHYIQFIVRRVKLTN